MSKRLASKPRSEKKSRHKKRGIRNMLVATFIILSMFLMGYYAYDFFKRPPVINLTEEPNIKKEVWMTYVPQDVLHFRVFNFTEISRTIEGREIFNNKVVLQFIDPPFNVTTDEVNWACDIEFLDSSIVNILSLNYDRTQYFENLLSSSNLVREKYLNVTIYQISSKFGDQTIRSGLAIYNSCLIYCMDSDKSNVRIKNVLQTALGDSAGFYSNRDFGMAYYIAAKGKSFMSLSFTRFTVIGNLNITWQLSVFQYDDSALVKSDVYMLESQDYAIRVFNRVKELFFINARSSWITDKFIIAEFHYPVSEIRTVIMGM